MSNLGLTFNELANSDDRNRGKMNILVIDANENNDFSNQNFLRNNNESTNKKPLIFEIMDNLNKKFEQIEEEVKINSINLKKKVEIMQNKLMTIDKTEIRYADATYLGETKGKEVTGFGIIQNDDGCRYEGQMLDSNRNGIGIFYGKDGDIFMGEYKNNKRNGFGIEENPKVGKYEGNWLDDSLTGTGKLSYKTGLICIGNFDKAQLSGFGKMEFIDGSYFIGQFKEGFRVKGKTFYADEMGIFDANWEENENSCLAKGVFYFIDGRKENRTRAFKGREGYWEYN